MNELLWIAICLFCAVGLAQCVGWAVSACRRPKGLLRGYHIIPLYDDPSRLEAQLRYGLSRLEWGGRSSQIVLLADMGLGEESAALCEQFVRQHPGLICCPAGNLAKAIRNMDQLQCGGM